MDSIYSLSLLVSLLSGASSFLLSALALVPRLPAALPRCLRLEPKRRRLARLALYLSLLSLLISVTVHLLWGHRPGTPDGLAIPEFLRVHPSYLVAAGLPTLSALLLGFTEPRSTRLHRGDDG